MSTEEQMKQAFVSILTKGKKDNTYKFALARYLLDHSNSPTENLEIPYADIAKAFLKYYWHQECKFRIRQNFHKDKPPAVIKIIRQEFGTTYIPDSFNQYLNIQLKTQRKKYYTRYLATRRKKHQMLYQDFKIFLLVLV